VSPQNALGHRSGVDALVFTGPVGLHKVSGPMKLRPAWPHPLGHFFVGFSYGPKFFLHLVWTKLIGKNYAVMRAFWAKFHALL
jgi:hypothetical protein